MAERKALVTGAGSGIGATIVWALAETGSPIALHYHHNRDAVETLADQLQRAGHQAYIVQGDLSTHDGPVAVGNAAQAALGSIDILVNCAGDWVDKPLLKTVDAEWDRLLTTDLRGTYLLIRTVAPQMVARHWGRIVNLSSIASLNYVPGEGIYGIAKAGINMLTKAFGAELAGQGVTVNAVAPGWTLPADQPYPPQACDYPQCRDVPDGRPGHAREVAAMVSFLVSDLAAHLTGQVLPIDGGLSVTMAKGR